MLSTAEASKAVLAAMPAFASESIDVSLSPGRVLRQAIEAERDQPPFDRVTMDGIAIRHESFADGNRSFPIEGRQHAGEARSTLNKAAGCIEIMTGAVLPAGCDCVVPVERLTVADGNAVIESDYEAERFQFIHPQGSDHVMGHKVMRPGHRIAAPDVAVVVSCGLKKINVSRRPTIRVISTGDELVPAGEPIASHQIRMSNGPAVIALLKTHGYSDSTHDHLVDDKDQLRNRIRTHLDESEALILSGGVSMGKADFIPEVLNELGVDVVFHKISQRPGKPMWFGIGPENQAVFALPGNPVSTLVCCRQYVIPALEAAEGLVTPSPTFAALADAYTFKPELTCFLPVRVESDAEGRLVAWPVPTNTSGDFTALSNSDGYIELAMDETEFEAGSVWPYHAW